MAVVTPPYRLGLTRSPGFTAILRSEWTKIRSLRATYIQLFLAVGLALGMAALIALAIGSAWNELSEADQAEFESTFTGAFGVFFSTIVLIVTGVTFASSEYSSGMIRLTFSATPSRGRVLFAKAIILAAVTVAVGLVVAFGTFFVSQLMLATYEGVPTASLGDDGVLRAMVGSWLTTPAFPLIGLALGFILRSTASAITATLGLVLLPAIFGSLLPDFIQENVMRFLPGNAGDHLVLVDPSETSALYLQPALAAAVLLAWIAGFLLAAYALLRARDV